MEKGFCIYGSPHLREYVTNGKMESKTKWEVKIDARCIK